jgi:hypothetical protein
MNREGHIYYKSHQVICYADDMAIVSRTEKDLGEIIQNLIEADAKMGLTINEQEK